MLCPFFLILLQLGQDEVLAVFTPDENGGVEFSKCQAYSPDWAQVIIKKNILFRSCLTTFLLYVTDCFIACTCYGLFETWVVAVTFAIIAEENGKNRLQNWAFSKTV